MNVIISSTIYPPDIGGPATYAYEINERLVKKGHNITILTTSTTSYKEDIVTIPKKVNIRILGFFISHIQIIILFMKLRNKFDLIYTLDPAFLGFTSIFCGFILRKPVLLRYSGEIIWENAVNKNLTILEPDKYLKTLDNNFYLKLIFKLQKKVMYFSKKIIVPSEAARDLIIDFYNVGDEKISIVPNSVEYNYNYIKKNYNNFQIISVGRLIKLKRVDEIIKIFKEVKEVYHDVELIVIGEGPERSSLEKLTLNLGLSDSVKFTGNLSKSELRDEYIKSHLLILNSIYEISPHVLIEAMVYGVAVITTSKGGPEEIVQNNKNGISIEYNRDSLKSAICSLIINEELRTKLCKNAYISLNKYNWERNLILLENELEVIH